MSLFRTLQDLTNAWNAKADHYKAVQQVLEGNLSPFDIVTGQGKKPDFSKQALVEEFKSWVYVCSSMNAKALARGTLRLYATRAVGQERANRKARVVSKTEREYLVKKFPTNARIKAAQEIEEIEEHQILDVLHNINAHENSFETFEKLSLFLDNTGDAYWHIGKNALGVPNDIWTLPSQYVKIVPDKKDYIKGYVYGTSQMNQQKFLPDEVIHFKLPSMTNLWYGYSRVEGAYWAITGYKSMELFDKGMTDNLGIPSLLLKYKGILQPKQRRDLLREWNNALRGPVKAGSTFVADGDVDVSPLSLPPRELAFLNGRAWRKGEIINAYGQNEALYDKNANTANIQGAIYLWEKWEVTSNFMRVEQKLNEKFIPMFTGDTAQRLFLAFDPIVKEDMTSLRADLELQLKHGLPLNRALEEMGREPVENGDIGYVQANLVPLGTPPALSGNNSAPGIQSMALSHTANDRAIRGRTGASRKGDSSAVHTLTIKADGGTDVALSGGANAALTAREQAIKDAMAAVWAAQTILALEQVPNMAGADFAWVASEEWAKEIMQLTQGAFKEEVIIGGKRGARAIGVQITDFIDRPSVRDAILNENFKFAQAIGNGSADALRSQMLAGMNAGESIPQLTARIQGVFTGWEKWRAERVARTESARALSLGTELQWVESGVVANKVWDANGDACPFCLDMHGKIIELGVPFIPEGATQGIEFEGREIRQSHDYAEVMGPPLHPNCRCTIRPQLIEF